MTVSKRMRIGCLHAHHTNIRYLEEELASGETELLHFVDPGLIYRLTGSEEAKAAAAAKVRDQLAWIEGSGVDAVIITCTNYIAALDLLVKPQDKRFSVPVIPIDEPWFDEVLELGRDAVFAFTNPATVEGTMERFRRHAAAKGMELNANAAVADNSFELLMQGRTEAYNRLVESFIEDLLQSQDKHVIITQLSMTDAARRVEHSHGIKLIQPIRALYRTFKA